MKKENIYNFLQSERFIHEGKSTSDFFGDSYDLFQKGTLKIRFSNSRSTQMVDVGCSFDDNNWYDLALVKALLEGGRKLDKETSFDEHIYFLSENITSIMKTILSRNLF